MAIALLTERQCPDFQGEQGITLINSKASTYA